MASAVRIVEGSGGGKVKKPTAATINNALTGAPKGQSPFVAQVGSVMTSAQPRPAAVSAAPVPAPSPVTSAVSRGGGGGGSAGASALVPQPAPVVNIADWLPQQFAYQQAQRAGEDDLADYDAQTLYGQQQTEAGQAVKRAALQDQLDRLGQNNAEDFASRGLGRSGLVFKEQDNIDKQGVTQKNAIDDLLSQFIQTRQTGRQQQEQANRAALQNVMNQLTTQFATSQLGALS